MNKQNTAVLRIAFLFSIVCGLCWNFQTKASESSPGKINASKILVLGDSISAGYGMPLEKGWVNLLEIFLQENYPGWTTINASVSGETTSGGLARFPDLLDAHNPEIVIIELGGNDGLRGHPISSIKENLSQIVALTKQYNALPIIVEMQIPPNYGKRYTDLFTEAFGAVAQKSGAVLIPFFLEQMAITEGFMQDDGIHPTADAQPIMLEGFLPFIRPLLGEKND